MDPPSDHGSLGSPTHLPDQCPPSCTEAEEIQGKLMMLMGLSSLLYQSIFPRTSYPTQNPQDGLQTTVCELRPKLLDKDGTG